MARGAYSLTTRAHEINMTKKKLITEIDKIIAGIEADRFTIENLMALRTKIVSSTN
jgi:hypothetical protein